MGPACLIYAVGQYVIYVVGQYVIYAVGQYVIYAVGQYVIFLFLYSLTEYKLTGRKNETERISYQMKWNGYCFYYVAFISC